MNSFTYCEELHERSFQARWAPFSQAEMAALKETTTGARPAEASSCASSRRPRAQRAAFSPAEIAALYVITSAEPALGERSDAEKLWKQGIVKLNHPVRVRWDVLIICFTIYNCIELPIEVGFKWRNSFDTSNVSDLINPLIDLFFGFDIIFNFFTTYFHSTTGEEI